MAAAGCPERRRHERLSEPFFLRLRRVAETGEAFDLLTVLENFSAGGLYVRLPHRVDVGAKLFAVVCFTVRRVPEASWLQVAVRSRVVRTEVYPDGRCGAGVVFVRHRFL